MQGLEEEVKTEVRSRPVLRRLRNADDKYGWVLAAILVTLIAVGAFSQRSEGRIIIPLLFLGIFFLTLLTSGVRTRTMVILLVLIPVVVAIAGIATASKLGSVIGSLSPLESTLLVVACVIVIARRLATHELITRETVFGSLCVYLFGALLFALVYGIIAALSSQPFFVQTDQPSGLDYIYFSFVTIATLGFGDFTPATDVGKMAVTVEAITGQLYLVVVVALFVSRMGRRRGDPAS